MKELEEVYKKGFNVSNDFIGSMIKNNNKNTLKMLFWCVFKGKKIKKEELTTIVIPMGDLKANLKIDFTQTRRTLQELQKTLITINQEKNIIDMSLMPKVEYVYHSGNVEIKVFNEIMKELYEIEKQYTTIDLYNLIKLNNKHSIRFITILEKIDNYSPNVAKTMEISKDKLNEIFDTNYKSVKEIERAILSKVKDELDEFSKLTFTWHQVYDINTHKKGRKPIIGVKIFLEDNKQRQGKLPL